MKIPNNQYFMGKKIKENYGKNTNIVCFLNDYVNFHYFQKSAILLSEFFTPLWIRTFRIRRFPGVCNFLVTTSHTDYWMGEKNINYRPAGDRETKNYTHQKFSPTNSIQQRRGIRDFCVSCNRPAFPQIKNET